MQSFFMGLVVCSGYSVGAKAESASVGAPVILWFLISWFLRPRFLKSSARGQWLLEKWEWVAERHRYW